MPPEPTELPPHLEPLEPTGPLESLEHPDHLQDSQEPTETQDPPSHLLPASTLPATDKAPKVEPVRLPATSLQAATVLLPTDNPELEPPAPPLELDTRAHTPAQDPTLDQAPDQAQATLSRPRNIDLG